ncbi:unnamed protein product, partial [Iphiclides podalirius]
MYIETIL